METIVTMTIIGIVATAAMNCFLWLITGLTQTQCDMVRAVGAIYTHDEKNSLLPGLIMQFTAGLIAAYVYGVFLEAFAWKASYAYAGMGLAMGLIHGIAVSIVLAKLLGEHHPVEHFQKVSTRSALAHVLAHMLYGFIIGAMYGTYMAF